MVELHVRAVCARNLLDKQTFGKQDPYCKITVRNRTFKTRVHDNGDKSPVWNERFTFDAHDPQLDQLVIEVKDKNFTSSTLIGEVRLPVNMFLHGNLVDEWYTLNNGNKRAGEINLRVQLIGPGIGGGKGEKAAVPAPVAYAQPAVVAAAYPAPQQAAAAYPPQGTAHAYPPQPQYAQQPHYPPQQPYYAPNQQHYAQPQHYPPPPQQGYAYPPPQPAPVMYGAPAPVYGAPQPVMYVQGAPGYRDHHHHHGGHRRRGSGGDAAEMALGVGAGVLGGALLADVLF
uniref:C2 domain-containing protein n=1 Tax=Globisporangium ultimum (strain ATCC 200006 / CBS 805.95 / DAOM BR144) TaxID=431595 RepID=K3WB41_GLOUD